MDSLILFGLVIVGLAIAASQVVEGAELSLLFNGSALLIVLGVTFAAVFIQASLKQFLCAINLLTWLVKPPKFAMEKDIKKVFKWSFTARREGLVALQNAADQTSDEVIKIPYCY